MNNQPRMKQEIIEIAQRAPFGRLEPTSKTNPEKAQSRNNVVRLIIPLANLPRYEWSVVNGVIILHLNGIPMRQTKAGFTDLCLATTWFGLKLIILAAPPAIFCYVFITSSLSPNPVIDF